MNISMRSLYILQLYTQVTDTGWYESFKCVLEIFFPRVTNNKTKYPYIFSSTVLMQFVTSEDCTSAKAALKDTLGKHVSIKVPSQSESEWIILFKFYVKYLYVILDATTLLEQHEL